MAQFHGVIWWIIIYELFFVVGYMVVLGLGLLPSYHNMVHLIVLAHVDTKMLPRSIFSWQSVSCT